MPRSKKNRRGRMDDGAESEISGSSLRDNLESELKSSYSYVNLVLGLLIVLVIGVLLFNYFKKDQSLVTPTDDTNTTDQNAVEGEATTSAKDVEVGSLPGKYTVKPGDTLFLIAQKYYSDGYQFTKIVEANKLESENVEVGMVLEIPKLDTGTTPSVAPVPTGSVSPTVSAQNSDQTNWGPAIKGDSYTVAMGDSLKSISGRAYGNEDDYTKIAKANNIQNPDAIEVGMVLKIPR